MCVRACVSACARVCLRVSRVGPSNLIGRVTYGCRQDIVSRVQSEREFRDRLETMTEELRTRHHRLAHEHTSLKFKYNTLKYSGLSELKK